MSRITRLPPVYLSPTRRLSIFVSPTERLEVLERPHPYYPGTWVLVHLSTHAHPLA